jgi:nitrogen PTS system EIIA component
MQVVDILTPARVAVTAARSHPVRTKRDALRLLAELLCTRDGSESVASPLDPNVVETLLARREETLSTGVGGGVAIPHAAVETLTQIRGALLLCRDAIGFDAVDGLPCNIFFAVIGPRGEVGQHLKTLARVSRLLRDESFRQELVLADSGAKAFELIVREESRPQ